MLSVYTCAQLVAPAVARVKKVTCKDEKLAISKVRCHRHSGPGLTVHPSRSRAFAVWSHYTHEVQHTRVALLWLVITAVTLTASPLQHS